MKICGSCTYWHTDGRCHYAHSRHHGKRRRPMARACYYHLADTQLVNHKRGPRTIPPEDHNV